MKDTVVFLNQEVFIIVCFEAVYKTPSTKLSVFTAVICSTLTKEIVKFSEGGKIII